MIELTCDQMEAGLTELLEGTLDGPTAEAATRHLAECDSCRVVVDQTNQIRTLGSAYGRLTLDERARDRIRRRLDDG